MKNLFLVIAMLISTYIFAQEQLTFTDSVEVGDQSQEVLFNKAKIWFGEMAATESLVIDSENNNVLSGTGTMRYEQSWYLAKGSTTGNIDYKIKVFVKDNEYKYVLTEFVHRTDKESLCPFEMGLLTTAKTSSIVGDVQPKVWIDRNWNEMKSKATNKVNFLIESLYIRMNTLDATDTEPYTE